MLVFRVENDGGDGPFTSIVPDGEGGEIPAYLYDSASTVGPSCHTIPTPVKEGYTFYNMSVNRGKKFGFYSLTDVVKYFPCPSGREVLQRINYNVSVYDVSDEGDEAVVRGSEQVAFNEAYAKRIDRFPWSDIYKKEGFYSQ